MTDSTSPKKGLQWKWVAISFFLYVVFYLFPILVASGDLFPSLAGRTGDFLLSIWAFAGIILIAAAAGFISKGITIWEPAIAAAILFLLLLSYVAFHIVSASVGHRSVALRIALPIILIASVAFLLSLLGAWLGERAQKLWGVRPTEHTP